MIKMFSYIKSSTFIPRDDFRYLIPDNALRVTERVLKEYGRMKPSNEGIVYWGGWKDGNQINISLVIAPKTISNFGRVETSPESNFYVVQELSKHSCIQLAQIHTHPTSRVGHSCGDDKWAAFKVEGLLSVVVPSYAKKGFSLDCCGVHRFQSNRFIRLSKKYVTIHFEIKSNTQSLFIDLR